MRTHYLIEGIGKLIASASPFTDLSQPQKRRASELRGIKILMRDRVSPGVQFLQSILTRLITKIQLLYFIPERKSESIVVLSNVSGVRISCLELSVLGKNVLECRAEKARRHALHEVAHTLHMQVTTKSLKLGRKQYGVRLIDLLGCVAPSAARPADTSMSRFQLIESGLPYRPPRP
ncbi:MAG TPA: hypothetical protein VH682_21245 [Gemmataceae bacterium]|jgi:hypothetical protein